MHASWKIASSALLVLGLAGIGGCVAGDEPEDGAYNAAQQADEASGASDAHGPSDGVNVSVIINQNGWNDSTTSGGHGHHDWHGHHHHHGHHGCGGHGFHGDHHGDPAGQSTTPDQPPADMVEPPR